MIRRAALAWIGSGALVLGALLLLGHSGLSRAAARSVRPCARPEVLRAGEPVASWRLGAIDMLTARDGVAVTAARVGCARPARGGGEVEEVGQTALLAVTRDGGVRWSATGRALPAGPLPISQGVGTEQIVAASLRRAWVLGASQQLVATADGGATWHRVAAAPGPVSIGLTGRALWVLSCLPPPSGGAHGCPPRLERFDRSTGQPTHLALPGDGRTIQPFLRAVDDRTLVVDESTGDGSAAPLLVSTDGGRRWERRALPRWQGNTCPVPSDLAVLDRRNWWLICLGGAAAQSSAKALFATADAGRRWTLACAVASLTGSPPPGAITRGEPYGLAAASRERLWLATLDGVEVSQDAGHSWRALPNLGQQGDASIFDVLGPERAWLLSPGRGLWRTTDGEHWTRLGRLGPD